MPKPRKRLAGAAGPAGPDNKGPAGKRTKTKNPAGASATMGNSSPEKTSASKDSGKNLSNYWLMKSEPESRLEKGVDVKFSIEDLKAQPKQTACWDGVRNYQARNFLRAMKLEQEAFFYHSNCKEPGIAGLVKVSCMSIRLNPSPFRETSSYRYKGTQLRSVTKKEVLSSPSLMSQEYGKTSLAPSNTARTITWQASFQVPLVQTSFLCLGLSLKNRPDDSSSKPGVIKIRLLTAGGKTVVPIINFNTWF
ncbi:thymocyte nuclear protein 1 isoform X2 [Ursus americanus]|uniref:Thymocyte nuclear protein 1 n=1 Tax=Ursus americanus TaxID=9643 RepID=A0A452SGI6_URSAM|nr:thymocyte nuclear protein 1 isoform X2 [Ursus americanus]XP_045646701.1 thymocyte nuclear protein 1 isoform X2 [Ursus americanus]XP_045646702.1 thymocyte nuclear protein 1 isoform X2 [Ursus americanus]